MSRCVFVGNLPEDVSKREIEDLFQKYGKIRGVTIKRNRNGGSSFAFVNFDDIREAEDAVRGRDGVRFDSHRLRVEIHEVGLLVGRPGGTGGGFKGGRDGRDSHEIPNAGPPQRSDRRDVVTDHMRQAGHGQVGVVESSCRERALTTDFRTHPWDATRVGERDVGRVWRSRSRRRDEGQDERKAMCRPSRRHSGPSRPLSRPVSPAHSRPRIPSRAPRDSEGAALRGTEVRPFRDLVREGMGKYGTDKDKQGAYLPMTQRTHTAGCDDERISKVRKVQELKTNEDLFRFIDEMKVGLEKLLGSQQQQIGQTKLEWEKEEKQKMKKTAEGWCFFRFVV
eukprot:GHVR01084551.1.p1 GENE.GHVR01084551.1~~GHVR01084551.1.p1  ORF type:complete len:337 (+),score=49.82 GHVR01084551.1:19-1029(+)